MTPNTERRILSAEDVELRIDGDNPTHIVGYAALFNKDSLELWPGYIEQIAPGAFTNVLRDSDVRALKNHDPNLVLGRQPNTLMLTEDSRGLRFNITAPDTGTGRDTVEEIRRGDISGCSFSFTVKSDTWDRQATPPRRTITEIGDLIDLGPVTFPAYPDTTVAARALEQFKSRGEAATPRLDDAKARLAAVSAADGTSRHNKSALAASQAELASEALVGRPRLAAAQRKLNAISHNARAKKAWLSEMGEARGASFYDVMDAVAVARAERTCELLAKARAAQSSGYPLLADALHKLATAGGA